MSHTLRAAAAAALVVVLSVVWVVDRTIKQAQDSNQGIVHTQEVLDALEDVLAAAANAESAVRIYLRSGRDRELEPLDRAERTIGPMIDRLTALTADNPNQQTRMPQLRHDATRALAALRMQVQVKRGTRASSTEDAEVQECMDAVRGTMRTMRAEEDRVLADRAQADRIAVTRLQHVSITLVAIGVGLLAWIVWLMVRNVRREQQGAQVLRQANKYLETRVGMGVADLRDSNTRLRSIIDSAVDGITVIDATGRIESFNRGAEQLFGYSESEVIGGNVSMLMPSPHREEHDAYLARHLATGTQKIIGTGREVTGRRKDGSTFPLHLSVGKMTVGGETKFTGILHDLSARVRMEEQLREQAALARLGEMAAVIAHEVKNPLAGVRGAVQVIATRLPKDSKDVVMAKEIVSRIDSLNELVKDMLLFARPPQPKPAPIDVATLVTTTADLLGSDPALKQVRVKLDGTAPYIMADPDLLKIVFVNLLVNGAHAMNGRGTIRVSLGASADACQIAFADEGPGIPSDVREKIFMPFFTTKFRGSGLGLPTAKRLVEAHRGSISIACPPAGGTVVTVQLPGVADGVI